MIENARDWVPESALAEPLLQAELDRVIEVWSKQWFSTQAIQRCLVATARNGALTQQAAENDWRCLAPDVAIGLNQGAALSLARGALALGSTIPKMSDSDERLLVHYGEHILRELAQGLSRRIGHSSAPRESDAAAEAHWLEMRLGTSERGAVFSLRIAKPALAVLRKRLCKPFNPPPADRLPLSLALAASPVDVEASLGMARISVRDLQAIAPGDIIVLERAASDPVLLRSTSTGAAIAGVKLAGDKGVFELRMS